MKRIVTSAQAKEIDRYSMEELGMPGIVLMERAALRFAERVMERLTGQEHLLFVCGSGNNGGDGMASARILSEKGYSCAVYLAGKPEKMTESAGIQWNLLKHLGVSVVSAFAPEPGTVIIDALFGVGLSREVTGDYAELIQKMNGFRCFAVDLPSGLNADNGQGMAVMEGGERTAVKAEMTVTFGAAKAGLLLGTGRKYAGEVFVEDIGFPKAAAEHGAGHGYYLEKADRACLLPKRNPDFHKGSFGKTLVLAGSETMIGAAFYAGKAAYHMGAGLVEIVTCRQNIQVLAGMLPAAVYFPVEAFFHEREACDLEMLKKKLDGASAVVLGPGLGLSDRAKSLTVSVLKLLSGTEKPLVLDADGLNLIAEHGFYEFLSPNMILTPHLKEMSRLCRKSVQEIKNDMVKTAAEFAKAQDVTLVLKDSRSVITDGKDYYINLSGNEGMAVGGSGDVLSGILGGLMAQKRENSMQMAAFSVYLHGLAGDAAKEKKGSYSMMAEDILDGLPEILRG